MPGTAATCATVRSHPFSVGRQAERHGSLVAHRISS